MANKNAPFGFCQDTRTGSSYIGGLNLYSIPATNADPLGVGDPVTSAGSADANGIPTVVRSTAGDVVRGYIVGFVYDRSFEDLPNYRPASTAAGVYVADDPAARVLLQEDSVGGALTAASAGLNVNFIVADANAVTGRSQVQIDSNTAAPTATLPLKLIQIHQTDDNELGDNAIWECTFNTHELKADTGSTGV
jgi:hypothetical protein